MQPVVTPDQMRRIDAASEESLPVLVERAGWAVAVTARSMLGGTYGRRVTVLAGPGNNGADGRVAGRLLERWGARCRVLGPDGFGARLDAPGDLVIDACFGTGLRHGFDAPDVGATPVLAVDIPSGVDGTTGEVAGRVLRADRTVTFVAPKPGLLLWPGADHVGRLTVADVGLPTSAPGEATKRFWFEPPDALDLWPDRPATAHKWRSAVWVVGGSPGMNGAPALAGAGAARAGAGYVRLSIPGSASTPGTPTAGVEVVEHQLGDRWAEEVLADAGRFGALVIGPGLATDETTLVETRRVIARWPGPLVVDAGALAALGREAGRWMAHRIVPAVLTPHDGELARLAGTPGGERPAGRVVQVEALARDSRCVVLAKGPTTLVAEPDGRTWFCTSGTRRLATAGTGDVLSGVIGAALARGLQPGTAAAVASELHGQAAGRGHAVGLVAGDLPELVARHLSSRCGSSDPHTATYS